MPDKPPVRVKPLGQYTKEETSITPATSVMPAVAAGGAGPPNNGSHPLSPELIERALDRLEISHWRGTDGAVFAVFSDVKPQIGGSLKTYFLIPHADIFKMVCAVDRKVPSAKWDSALRAINEAHTSLRFGRFQLELEEDTQEAWLLCDAQVALSEGATETFLADFVMSNLTCTVEFFQTAYREKGLYGNGKRRGNGKKASNKDQE